VHKGALLLSTHAPIDDCQMWKSCTLDLYQDEAIIVLLTWQDIEKVRQYPQGV